MSGLYDLPLPDIVQRVFERLAEAGRVNAPEGPGASA